mgnify:CR=1 FL=1
MSWQSMREAYRTGRSERPHVPGRRLLTEDDYDDFMMAIERPDDLGPLTRAVPPARRHGPKSPPGFMKMMSRRYPLRVRRLRRDFRWLQNHARKNDIDPEDVRWML